MHLSCAIIDHWHQRLCAGIGHEKLTSNDYYVDEDIQRRHWISSNGFTRMISIGTVPKDDKSMILNIGTGSDISGSQKKDVALAGTLCRERTRQLSIALSESTESWLAGKLQRTEERSAPHYPYQSHSRCHS